MQCASARAVITVSDFSRQELLEFLPLPQAKVLAYTTRTAEQGHIDCARCTPPIWLQGLIISYIGRH